LTGSLFGLAHADATAAKDNWLSEQGAENSAANSAAVGSPGRRPARV